MEEYQKVYEDFITRYKAAESIDGEEVGSVIAVLAQHFGERNLVLVAKENALRRIAVQTINGADPVTMKPMSAAKAEIIIDSTNEASEYRLVKAQLENINQYINALKVLQKGILNEFSHMNS